ncbi:MAG TPA: response regulator transcription factor [Acidimicrobiales bacterium]|nr:response regulator transcription factor [Acidimicrobiales bacterium]
MSRSIRVVIVDDDALVRSALTLMLGGQPDLAVVGEAPDGRAGVDLIRAEQPDVVLMDIRMPVMDGLEATRVLHADPRPPRVIVLTTFDGDDYVVGAIAAGADGFLLKDTPPADIVDAIRKVAAGEAMLSPSATQTLVRRIRDESGGDLKKAEAEARAAALTPRERDVAIALARGASNAEIADELFLSVPTVKAHITRILDKLGATNRVQVAICIHDAGLT